MESQDEKDAAAYEALRARVAPTVPAAAAPPDVTTTPAQDAAAYEALRARIGVAGAAANPFGTPPPEHSPLPQNTIVLPGGAAPRAPTDPAHVPNIQFAPGSPGRLIPGHEEQRGRTVQTEQGTPVPEEAVAAQSEAEGYRMSSAGYGIAAGEEQARAQRQAAIAQQELNRQTLERQQLAAEEKDRTLKAYEQKAAELAPDPKKTWDSLDTFTQIRFGIAGILGDLAETKTGKNRARELINQQLSNDLASQQAKYDANAKSMGWARKAFDDRDSALAATQAAKLKAIELEVTKQIAGTKSMEARQRGMDLMADIAQQRAQVLDTAAQRKADKVVESTSYAQVAPQIVGGSGPRAIPSTVKAASESYLARGGDPAKLPEYLKMQGVDKQTVGTVMMGLSTPTGAYEARQKADDRAAASAVKEAPSPATYVREANGFATSVEDAKAIKTAAIVRARYNSVLDQIENLHKNASVLSALPGADRRVKADYDRLRAEATGIVTEFQNTGAATTVEEMQRKVDPLIPTDPTNLWSQIATDGYRATVDNARKAVDNTYQSQVQSRGVMPGRLEFRNGNVVPVLEGTIEQPGDKAAAAQDFKPAGE